MWGSHEPSGAVNALRPPVEPLPDGAGEMELEGVDAGGPIKLYTYRPPGYRDGALLVVCHGCRRNAEQYRDFAAAALAERFGLLVVAPQFDAARFPRWRYNDGGLRSDDGAPPLPSHRWTFAVVRSIVELVRAAERQPRLPYYLIGHSAGGQFLARLAGFMPGEARRIVAVNPSSCLFPTRELDFRYGFGRLPPHLGDDAALRRYLAAPLTLYLGADDKVATSCVDASEWAAMQGPDRLSRGRACYEAGRRLAASRGWPFNWQKVEAVGVGHSAPLMFAAIEARLALFGSPPES